MINTKDDGAKRAYDTGSLTNPKFKTGDPHPNPRLNLMRFVEYDPGRGGVAVWCSIYEDSDGPYRLAKNSQQRRENNRRVDVHLDNQTHPHQE
jgi:hypothetical protein